jgi:hypothetical protein
MVIVRKFIFLVTAAIFNGRQAVGHSFKAEINKVNVGLNGKMNEICFSQILDYR